MINLKERYVVDEKGTRIAVLLDIEDYQKLLEDLEELESILPMMLLKPLVTKPFHLSRQLPKLSRIVSEL